MHGQIMLPGRHNERIFFCPDCQRIACELGCEMSEQPYLFETDPKTETNKWWTKHLKEHKK